MSKKVLEEVTEWCPDCGYETTKKVDISTTHSIVCENCGKKLYLCSICYEECKEQCNPNNPKSFCNQISLKEK